MATHDVNTAIQLRAALAIAVGGDTIRLAAGNYGDVSIRDLRPTEQVTLTSLDDANPAHFDTLQVRTSQNLVFEGLDIGRPLLSNELEYTQMASVRGSSRIVFDNVHFHGSLDGNAKNDGFGLLVDTVSALTIINSRFEQLTKGLVVSNISNLQISNNRFDDMRSDGLNVSASKNVVIEGNRFQGFYPEPNDHPDAIQIFNTGYRNPTTDVMIRNNVLLPGGSYGPQGIWIADPVAGFSNFTIENNVLWSEGSYNGIGLFGLTGGLVRNNTVLSPDYDLKTFWIRVKDGSNIDIIDNVTEDFIIEPGSTNIRLIDNVNLRTEPSLRSQIANTRSPLDASDMILPGVGYQQTDSLPMHSPVSGAISSALNGVLQVPRSGAALGAMPVDKLIDTSILDFGQAPDAINTGQVSPNESNIGSSEGHPVFSSPVLEPFYAIERLGTDGWMHQYLSCNSFTALP